MERALKETLLQEVQRLNGFVDALSTVSIGFNPDDECSVEALTWKAVYLKFV